MARDSASSSQSYGREAISREEAEAFAARIAVVPSDREIIAQTLHDLPGDVLCRGMFFDGLLRAIRSTRGQAALDEVVEIANVPKARVPFTHYPHRHFYKLYFTAARRLHPTEDLEHAMLLVAETFYPVFRESLVGRTMAQLVGDDPMGILERLTNIYELSVQGNTHSVERTGPRSARWRALVEPTVAYPSVFTGIVLGMMRSHGAPDVDVKVTEHHREPTRFAYTFDIAW